MNLKAVVKAASRGIGSGCVRELAARGDRVALIARSPRVLYLAKTLSSHTKFETERYKTKSKQVS